MKLAGSAVGSVGKKLMDKVRGDRNLQKQWEFASSLHAHNEGISHHYAVERMNVGNEHALGQIREQGYMDRLGTINSGQVARQNLSHAAGVAADMPNRNVSMGADHQGGVTFSASKAPATKKPATAKPAAPAEPAPAAATNVRNNARGMASANTSKAAANKTPGVTTQRKVAPPKADPTEKPTPEVAKPNKPAPKMGNA